jgi:hypothetical protein
MGASVSRAHSYLVKHRHIFYFRVVVPVDPRPRLGRSELRHCLGSGLLV